MINPYNFNPDRIEEFKNAFHIFDKDQDATINRKEFKMALEHLNFSLPENEMDMMFDEADQAQNQSINFETFLKVLAKKLANSEVFETVSSGFKYLDKENTGFISTKEFRYLMANYGEKFPLEEIQEMITEGDPENTGKIKIGDFVNKLFGLYVPPPETKDDKKKGGKDGGKGKKQK